MKKTMFIIMLTISVVACKSKKEASSTVAATNSTQTSTVGATTGKVSQMYKAGGCSAVIIVKDGEHELTLIPKDKLASQFDVDGLEIKFNYRTLKMPNPAGCTSGIPAEITDISKK